MIKYLMLENVSLNLFERYFNKLNCYEIIDKNVEDISKLEFLSNNDYELVLSYGINVIDDVEILNREDYIDNEYELIIVIEKDRLLYLILNSNNEVVREFIIEDKDLLNYL